MNLGLKIKYLFWITLSVAIGIFLAFFVITGFSFQSTIKNNPKEEAKQTINTKNNEQQDFYFIKNPNFKLKVSAESYFVGDLDTGEIILAKNQDQKFPIASVSKLFTAAVADENQKYDNVDKVSAKALSTYGENGGFYLNEKIKAGDLIYPLLLESSNDAAEIIAENLNRGDFIEKMNQKVKDLGLTSTSFEDPSGLSEKNQSTASDLFRFAQYLTKEKPDLLQLTVKRSYSTKNHIWFNTSQFLGFEGYMGGKRGYIDESLQTALSVFTLPLGETGNRNIGIIVLRSPDRYKDVQNIYQYLKKNTYYGKESDADLAWVKQREGIVEETEPNFVTLAFGGDIMLDRGVKNSVNKNFNGDYSALFENLDILKKVDIAFANLEGPASDQGSDKHNLYSFRMDPSVVPALKGAGLSIVSVANNHEGDWGRDAYADTLNRLQENEIFYAGGGKNTAEAEQPTIIERNGMKIGYLGFTDVGPNWLEVTNTDTGLLLASNPRFDEIIKNAANQVDHLVVSFHFGDEYQTKHNARQELLAHKAIDDGAKIVIGHHPHVVEDTEVYKNGFIAYSLGNFIFDQYFSDNTMQGMLLEMKLYKDGGMTIKKNTLKLTKVFQPEKLIEGKEEKVKFQ